MRIAQRSIRRRADPVEFHFDLNTEKEASGFLGISHIAAPSSDHRYKDPPPVAMASIGRVGDQASERIGDRKLRVAASV